MSNYLYYQAIDWNHLDDFIDKMTWEKLTSQFWLDTRIPVSNDLSDWRLLTADEREVFNRAFVGLTLLDTLQSEEGANVMREDVCSPHEEAVLNNILFMESVHAKSYSTIFISLNQSQEIDQIFEWGNHHPSLQYKAQRINEIYQLSSGKDSRQARINGLKKKIASVFLESFLFYSGFYTPLWYLGHNKMANVAEIIKLIIRDESVHGTYLGYKFSRGYQSLSEDDQLAMKDWAHELLFDLYTNEEQYTREVYEKVGWIDEVLCFIQYNANKALQNLGFEPIFANATAKDINPIVLNGLSTETSNHDFFSQVGSGYLMGQVEAISDEDYLYL